MRPAGSTNSSYREIEAIQLSKTLISTYYMFRQCYSLTKVADTFQLPKGLERADYMFYDCDNLIQMPTSLRLPASCTNYCYFIGDSKSIAVDITHWFDDWQVEHNENRNLEYMFYGCSKLTGILPANKLWKDYTSYINGGSHRYMFNSCTELQKTNDIPTSWKQ